MGPNLGIIARRVLVKNGPRLLRCEQPVTNASKNKINIHQVLLHRIFWETFKSSTPFGCRIVDSEMFKITKLSETSLTSTEWQRGPQVKQLVRLSFYYFSGPRLWCFWCLHAPCVFSVGTHHCCYWGCCGES